MKKRLVILISLILILALSGCGMIDKLRKDPDAEETVSDFTEYEDEQDTANKKEETEIPANVKEEKETEDVVEHTEEFPYKDYVPEIGDETLKGLEEAINVFTVYEDFTPVDITADSVGWILDNWLVMGFCYGNPRPYGGLIMISGKGETPVDIDFISLEKGDECPYYGIRTSDFEKAISGFYGIDYKIPVGELNYETCVNDGSKTVEWSDSFRVSYEGTGWERIITDAENVDGNLILTVENYQYYYEEQTESTEQMTFVPNPDSMYGYSFKDLKIISSDSNYEGDLAMVTDPSDAADFEMSYDEIKAEENRIRDAVNSGAAVKVEIKSGVDGFDYARWYCFENGQLVFAYYHHSISGDIDHRFYFKDGRMIEWIEGNGNDDSNRIRHYLYEADSEPRWYTVEQELLNGSASYAK